MPLISQDSTMNMKSIQLMSLLGSLTMFASATAMAQDDNTTFSLSAGMEFTSGRYGGDVDIEDFYTPLTATVNHGRFAYRLTVPYLSVRGPEGTVIWDPGGEPVPGTGDITTESGLGDVIGSVTIYDVISNRRMGIAVDLTGTIKFGTADVDKGLSTGENDYTVQADFYKFGEKATLLSSVGYKFRGDPADFDLEDVLMASIGTTYKFTPELRGGLIFDYRESSIIGNDPIQELTGFISRRFSENWNIQFYALTGFTDSSPDWSGGIQIRRTLNQ
jgi:hypothetical protein